MDDEIFEKAKGLLEDREFPIWEIPAACGYGSYLSFHKAYGEKAGTTPRRYRRQLFPEKFSKIARHRARQKVKRFEARQVAETRAALHEDLQDQAKKERRDMKLKVVLPAQKMLAYTDKTVSEVADDLGVNRVRLFRYFKSIVGVSAGGYQKNAKIGGVVNSLVAGIVSPDQRPFEMP